MSEETVILHGAPTLAGIKTGSLFRCKYADAEEMRSSLREWNQRFSAKGIRVVPLMFRDGKVLLYLYRPARLSQDLSDHCASLILSDCGYCEGTPARCLSPIIFALLGMDEENRAESYKALVADMIKAKCSVHVLDHNFQEVDSIIARAAGWANSPQYDIAKANNAARFFHDQQMSDADISEFCESIETRLNELGITVKKTSYDVYQNAFQEDEKKAFVASTLRTRLLI